MNENDFDLCCGGAMDALENGVRQEFEMVFIVSEADHPQELLCMGVDRGESGKASVIAQIDQMMATRPEFAGLGTRVHWSPTQDGESTLSWLLVSVTAERDARFFVKRDIEDDKWWLLPPSEVPWFALSTAGSLRHSLQSGEPLHMKDAKDKPDLFRKATDPGAWPQADADGRL